MKRMLLALILPALLLSACGSSPEENVVETIEELAATVASVTDADSAKAAVEKIKALGPKMTELETEMEKKYETKDFEEKFEEDLRKRTKAAQEKFESAMKKIRDDPKMAGEYDAIRKALRESR